MSMEIKSFNCVLCGEKLVSQELLQEHFRGHANKTISTKGKLKTAKPAPAKIPENDSKEKVTCDVCSLGFDTVTQAIKHKFKRHPENSIKHYCQFCGMQFPLKFTKDKHILTHKGMSTIGNFPCTDCGAIFHNSQALNYHFKSTHKRIMSIFKPVPTPPPSKKIKINNAHEALSVYYCYLCGMEYIIKFNLQKHLEAAHSEEERNKVPENLIKCTTCDALFYNKKAYDNHNMYHKPDDLYVASEEQRLQTVTRVDQDFDIRRVQLVTDKFIPIDKPKRRRQTINTDTEKTKKPKQTESDDELSPTSSIESSDSENDEQTKTLKDATETNTTEISENKTNNVLNDTIPGNSKNEAVFVQKIIDPDIFLNISTNSKESEQDLKNEKNPNLIQSSTANDKTEPTN